MNDKASHFLEMADRINHNAKEAFGGAAVIVLPEGANAQAIELLLLDPHADVAQFLATIATRIQMIVKEIENQQRLQAGYGVR